jgi:hypothetical protein
MTEALTLAIDGAAEELAAIPDLVERYHAVREVRVLLAEGDARLKSLQRLIANDLKVDRTWAQVGEMLGVSGSRAEALAKGR